MQLSIPLPHAVDQDTADELVKESAYISKNIASFAVDSDANTVIVDVVEPADQHAITDKVERYIAAMLRGYWEAEPKIYRRNTRIDSGPISQDTYAELKRRDWLFEIGFGYFGFAGPALRLAELIDDYASALYKEHFAAVERSFPALIPSDILSRCGYLESHPNNITLVTHLIEDFDSIEEFRLANSGVGPLALPNPQALESPTTCLNPAACFPAYYTLENRIVPEYGMALTWLGRVFRYESKNINSLERLWEFNVRELVFIGSDDYVVQKRDQAVDLIGRLASAFDLDMFIQVATDPFFATVSAAKKMWQQSMESKYEIRLIVGKNAHGDPRSIAAGSINVHGAFFGDRFSIRTEADRKAYTGCVGLGIERLVFAAFTQHGFDVERWPQFVREQIF